MVNAELPVAMPRILVVDDEESITELLATALRFIGFEVTVASNGAEALAEVRRFTPDLVVLDVMMPDITGHEVCRQLRASHIDTPVIFLTARDSKEDRLEGFAGGADDYVVKPFSVEELVARIRAVLRRSGDTEPQSGSLGYADIELDDVAHRVTKGGVAVDLSPTEYELLRYLLENAERAVSKAEILDHVWEQGFDGNVSVVETYIGYLRRKVDTGPTKLIHTVRGIGYSLRAE